MYIIYIYSFMYIHLCSFMSLCKHFMYVFQKVDTKTANHPKPPETTRNKLKPSETLCATIWNHLQLPETIQRHPPETICILTEPTVTSRKHPQHSKKLQSTKQSQLVARRCGRVCKISFRFALFYWLVEGCQIFCMLQYILARIEDALSSKIILDNKKNLEKSLPSTIPTCGSGFTSWSHSKITFSNKERSRL